MGRSRSTLPESGAVALQPQQPEEQVRKYDTGVKKDKKRYAWE